MQIDRHILADSSRLIDALGRLNELSGGVMTLLVTDADGRMVGTLTDGDVRRALLRGVKLDAPVSEAMFRKFRFLSVGEVNPDTLRELRRHRLTLIPVLDGDGHIRDVIDTRVTKTVLPVGAILMAGGKGERLRPMTLTTPKPLLTIGDKAIIDYNIEALAAVGVKNISVTVNYLAEQLEEHFSKPVAGVSVKCVRESRPLGTIGSAALVEIPVDGDTIVMNSDLLTTISFEDLYLHHRAQEADITIAAVPYNVSVPYAILDTDGQRVTALEEKPSYSYYANAGIYIFSNALLHTLSPDERTDATDLIERAIAEGKRVSYFPINGTWIDIGSPVDFAHARELMRHLQQTLDA
ncbi:sugar phosphate nucleotidyltransferase [uncultured Duncaniella sp.]|uniref:sugar phosphate nucleotidyltransferase n=1 Tax=uncultured Duncaniella sp. TaxID=2768039 RepID=UPI0025D9CA98|nr:sugar phosphate nucleotidyltransferase [uncultured Duncaniella sp.]